MSKPFRVGQVAVSGISCARCGRRCYFFTPDQPGEVKLKNTEQERWAEVAVIQPGDAPTSRAQLAPGGEVTIPLQRGRVLLVVKDPAAQVIEILAGMPHHPPVANETEEWKEFAWVTWIEQYRKNHPDEFQ